MNTVTMQSLPWFSHSAYVRQCLRMVLMTAFAMVICLSSGELFAQVSGTIKDGDGEVLPGVTVRLKGTTKGAVSDKKGVYTIAATRGEVLTFSLIGYGKKDFTVGESTTLDVILPLDIQRLEDVVVVGYGSAIKKDLVGNIAKVKASEIADIPAPSFDVAMQGKAAGVVVSSQSGKLGQGIQIRVRGSSSISASNEPLYVIDGIPMTQPTPNTAGGIGSFGGNAASGLNPLADLNPQDIESLDVLKDAAAAAIYGARGANGVVLITTKRGRSGATKVNFSFQRGFSGAAKTLQFLNTKQYLKYYREAAANADRIDGLSRTDPNSATQYMEGFFKQYSAGLYDPAKDSLGDRAPNVDWGAAALRSDAPTTQIDLSISGGNDKTTFFVSGQYFDQEGIVIGNRLSRLSARINVDHKLSDIFKIGMNVSIARTTNERLPGDNAFSNPLQAVALTPLSPLLDSETNLPLGTPPGNPDLPYYYNPFIGIGNSLRTYGVIRNIGTVFGEWDIVSGLKLHGDFGFDIANQNQESWFNSKTVRNSSIPLGQVQNFFSRIENFNTNVFLAYNQTFDIHTIEATLGTSFNQSQEKSTALVGQDLPSDAFRFANAAAKPSVVDGQQTDFSFLSYFLRGNYRFKELILASASVRVDGSSRFGANRRYGVFPAAAVGVVLSQLDFLKDNEALSFLKIRASYGRTGNAEIGNFASRGLVSGDAPYNGFPGTRQIQLANPDLTWETTDQFDVGLDFGFLNNRITGEIDFYDKTTSGLLLDVNVPASTGFRTQTQNIGGMRNRGFEFLFNSDNVVSNEFTWRTSLNFAVNQNTVTGLGPLQFLEAGQQNRAAVGQSLGVYYSVRYAGVNPENGDALYYRSTKDASGNVIDDTSKTRTFSQAQRVYVGSPLPAWTAGVTNTFMVAGFELTFQFNATIGNKVNFYGVGRFSSANGRFEDNQTVDQLNSWRPDNKNSDIPEARLFFNNGAQQSTRFIYDGSFVRLRTATLAYSLPKDVLTSLNIGVSSLRLFVNALNLWTATSYRGWDPEVNSDFNSSNIAQGNDFYTPPQPRTFTFGVNIGF
jgi:TonB-dependent starch-binding outer membrane protein SusC